MRGGPPGWGARLPLLPSQAPAPSLIALTGMRLPVSNQHGARPGLYQAGARDYPTSTRHCSDHVFDARPGMPSRPSSGAPRLRIGALPDTSGR